MSDAGGNLETSSVHSHRSVSFEIDTSSSSDNNSGHPMSPSRYRDNDSDKVVRDRDKDLVAEEDFVLNVLAPTEPYLPVRTTDEDADLTLSEFYGSVPVPAASRNAPWYKVFLSFVGPGALVAVGYMDPGNWTTDIAGGSAFGYRLLWIILLSSLMAMFLQALALKLGLATGKDLAQTCRDNYPRWLVLILWIIMEIAICATGKYSIKLFIIAFPYSISL